MPYPDRQIVAFYNLENFFDTVDDPVKDDNDFLPGSVKDWSEQRYLEKLENITRSISSIVQTRLPAIIGVSEVENKTVLTDLLYQPAFNRSYDYIHHDSQDKRGIDVALLYDRNIFMVLSQETFQVEVESHENYTTRDILYVKGAFEGDDVIHFFVNHWPSRREGTKKSMPRRIAAAQSLSSKTQNIWQTDPQAKIVIMGDFNDLPVSQSISRYLNAKSQPDINQEELYNLAYIPYQQENGHRLCKRALAHV